MARTPDQDAALQLVNAALDAGHEAEGLLRVGPINPAPRRRTIVGSLLALLGLGDQRPPEPPAETTRRAANALDEFAALLEGATAALADPELAERASAAPSWGTALWDRSRTYAEIYAEFSRVLNRLRDHQNHLLRGRDR